MHRVDFELSDVVGPTLPESCAAANGARKSSDVTGENLIISVGMAE